MAYLAGSFERQNKTSLFSLLRVKSLFANLKYYNRIAQQRHDLLKLDDDRLKDIGISRYEAEQEANREFWDVPSQK